MKCRVCNSEFAEVRTDLPFKKGDNCIVIIKGLPVLQCSNCEEYIIEDSVMKWIEETLMAVSPVAELEIVRYAA